MKSLKTPLRYPGGKSRACTKMDVYIPDLRDYKEYREPFLGGGSVAIYITKKYPHLDRDWETSIFVQARDLPPGYLSGVLKDFI